jgi:DNA/RNA endonuclease G (NUC1)/V8-like Glu-specific endopeptidase
MDQTERVKRLKAMLYQISPGGRIEETAGPAIQKAQAFAFEAMESTPPPPVERAIDKVMNNREQELDATEMFALEAIVMPQNRPVVLVQGTSYETLDGPWVGLNSESVKDKIGPMFRSIGRIELPSSMDRPYGGTGFVVGDSLLMTNRHVAELCSHGLGMNIQYTQGDCAIDFNDAPVDHKTHYLTVRAVEMIHPYWDMALMRVDGLPDGPKLGLSELSPEERLNQNVVVVGYPARDDRNDLDLQDRIFKRIYNVKRLQPGLIRQRQKIRSFENIVDAMTHDASTLGGDSGSAVIDVENGNVIALHFGGVYLKANYGVPTYELLRDRHVTSVLGLHTQLKPTSNFDAAWRGTGDTETAIDPKPSPAHTPPMPPQLIPPPLSSFPGLQIASFTIPLHFSVSLGSPSVPLATVPSPVSPPAAELSEVEIEGVVVDQDYSTRHGYDSAFLEDIKVPLPGLSEAMKTDTAVVDPDSRHNGDSFELAYHHYSVYMNKRRRTAWFSAANVDGDNRPDIGKRQGDRWYIDPRINRSEQLGQEAFEPGIDRGHLTRREDTAWGDSVKSATAANNDTFHFTNCSLQASAFNRGKDRWQGLEQFLLEQHAKKDKRRMIVITGPLFGAHDPLYRNDRMNYSVRCSLQFWKVCVLIRERDGKPSATAFILSQDEIKNLQGFEESFDVAATQITIKSLEEQTNLDFGDLKNHDHFAETGQSGTLESPAGINRVNSSGRHIVSYNQILV